MLTCEGIYRGNTGMPASLLLYHFHLSFDSLFLTARAYMDNEIMQALLFQYIGMKWSAALKNAFRCVVESGASKCDTTTLT